MTECVLGKNSECILVIISLTTSSLFSRIFDGKTGKVMYIIKGCSSSLSMQVSLFFLSDMIMFFIF